MKGLRFDLFKKHQPSQQRKVNDYIQKLQHFWNDKIRKSWFSGKQKTKT